jgi:hypothetical protein
MRDLDIFGTPLYEATTYYLKIIPYDKENDRIYPWIMASCQFLAAMDGILPSAWIPGIESRMAW